MTIAIKQNFMRLILIYLGVTSLIAHISLVLGYCYASLYYGFSVSEFIEKAGWELEKKIPQITAKNIYLSKSKDIYFDGKLRKLHPRIILPLLSKWDGRSVSNLMRTRSMQYSKNDLKNSNPCGNNTITAIAACWIAKGKTKTAEKLIDRMLAFKITDPHDVGKYGNAWEYALAYDLLRTYPGLRKEHIEKFEDVIEQALAKYIKILDNDSASLWHGRTTLSSIAWLCAVVLEPNSKVRKDLILRAQIHYLNVLRAIELTEAWPEGYNYWIQSRAFLFVLASSAYINGLENSSNVSRIRHVLKRIGLWQIYATRPDNKIEGFGDEGSRVDLKDESRRVIDIIAQATQDEIIAMYSRYIANLHGSASYYSGYRWGFRLFNDPGLTSNLPMLPGLSFLEGKLPYADVFGKGAMNLFYLHSGWDKDSTFISFKAGHTFTHHGHYDAGHFTIFKGNPLAINSSVYAKFTSENRLNYSIRTIAKNSLLVLKPNEKVRPNKFFQDNVADGGQRITMPTGSAITSVDDWNENIGARRHYEAGSLINYEYIKDKYMYIKSDLTRAYNNDIYSSANDEGKVKKVERSLLYFPILDKLIIFDFIESIKSNYIKKWLLHSINKPYFANEVVLKGELNNGISESKSKTGYIKNYDSYLYLQRIYPDNGVTRLVGGKDFQYYIEKDADEMLFNGKNYKHGSSNKPWFDVGMWRLEIQPEFPRKKNTFLIVLTPSISSKKIIPAEPIAISSVNANAIRLAKSKAIVFIYDKSIKKIEMLLPGKIKELYLFGIPSNIAINIVSDTNKQKIYSNANGVAKLQVDATIPKGSRINIFW